MGYGLLCSFLICQGGPEVEVGQVIILGYPQGVIEEG